jgi:DnaJ-domain-containing protein 1
MHDPMLDVFYLIAATDKEVQAAERRFLRRVGKAIGRPIDFDRLERICRHLADGDDLPPGTFHCP